MNSLENAMAEMNYILKQIDTDGQYIKPTTMNKYLVPLRMEVLSAERTTLEVRKAQMQELVMGDLEKQHNELSKLGKAILRFT